MRTWLKKQLKHVEQLAVETDRDPQFFDDVHAVIRKVEKRATERGRVGIARLCNIRKGGIGPDWAKEILIECLGSNEDNGGEFIDIDQVASMLGVHPLTVHRQSKNGTIPPPERAGRSVRWRRLDIENIRGRYNGQHIQTNKPKRKEIKKIPH